MQNKVQDVAKSYDEANTSSDNILTQQDDMIEIVKTEQDRLLEKKKLIDQAEVEEKRKMLLGWTLRFRMSCRNSFLWK